MVMSGWAGNPDKQPWTWGEPYTSINRMYLKLKYRLMPYHYSYSRIAAMTGFPPIRAMALQFPQDRSVYANSSSASHSYTSHTN
jgi:alpha-glucosidase (family GH31 glycosyl hydrolase)